MLRRVQALCVAASLLAGVGAQRPLRAWLPDDVLVVVETADAGAAVGQLIDALGAVPTGVPETARAELGLALTAVRLWLGEAPSELGRQLAGGGAVLGLAPRAGARPELLAVLRPGDAAAAAAFLQRVAGNAVWARAGDAIVLADTAAGRDRLLAAANGGDGRWAAWPAAAAATKDGTAVRAFVDVAGLRRALGSGDLLAGLDGGGRFLLASLLPALLHGERLDAELRGGDALSLRVRIDGGDAAQAEPWRALLAAAHQPRTVLTPPPGTLAMLALDRDLRALLTAPARFVRAAEVANVQSFLSVADQLDGAHTSFTGDLLGGLGSPWTLYVLAGSEPEDGEAPALLLPAFALVLPLANARAEPILLRMAQALLLITNAERGQRHQRPFAARGVRAQGDGDPVHGLVATLPEWRGAGPAPTEYGVQPTLLFGHGHAVLASTEAAARALLAQAAAGARTAATGDQLSAFGVPIAAAAARSQRPLQLARMLDEGETAAQAERFWTIAGAVLAAIERAALRVEALPDRCTIELELRRRP